MVMRRNGQRTRFVSVYGINSAPKDVYRGSKDKACRLCCTIEHQSYIREERQRGSSSPMKARRLSFAAVAMQWMQADLKMESWKRAGRVSGWFVREIGQQCNLISAAAMLLTNRHRLVIQASEL